MITEKQEESHFSEKFFKNSSEKGPVCPIGEGSFSTHFDSQGGNALE